MTNGMTHARRFNLLLGMCFICVGCTASSAVPSRMELDDGEVGISDLRDYSTDLAAANPKRHVVRKEVTEEPPRPTIPKVWLSKYHGQWSTIGVGAALPALELAQLGGAMTKLPSQYGKQATVVLFWQPDRWMARSALEDLVAYGAEKHDPEQVAILSIAVRQPVGAVQRELNQAKATFPTFLDSDGKALATVGSVALPRVYVLDPTGKIVWFDIEYSEATRRELQQTLAVLTAEEENSAVGGE